ncbi:MAG: hypothetical protein RMJ43_07655 [Chloroherpetonaceae bacterium]|nr:hypothetical protein [Chthonomonadaceae bacterium]MDW8207697.1 hypothetical protein [Chloroherpetonaceae bacterium]
MRQGGRMPVLLAPVCAVFGAVVSPCGAQELTAAQVVARCRRAYRALKSYEGTAQVVCRTERNGNVQVWRASAVIAYARPGRIRVEGVNRLGQRYRYVSDGQSVTMDHGPVPGTQPSVRSGRWEHSLSVTAAMARTGGAALNASTTIPSLLLGTSWGNPLVLEHRPEGRVIRERVNGMLAYRVRLTTRSGAVTLWIDARTFLLLQMQETHDLGKMATSGPFHAPRPRGTVEYMHRFRTLHRNGALSPAQFALPERSRTLQTL